LGPEGIIYISAEQSPTDTALVVIANEVSATLSVYSLNNVVSGIGLNDAPTVKVLSAYPNPTRQGKVVLSENISFAVYGLNGQLVARGENTNTLDLSGQPAGLYLLIATDGRSLKLMVD
jgi:hypothetical protein